MSQSVVSVSGFWNFSLALYRQPGVAESCLRLQNEYKLDINLVLFCLWYAREHGTIPDSLMQSAVVWSKAWKGTIVQALRDIRTRMKGNRQLAAGIVSSDFEALRGRVESLELAAEQMQQHRLQALADVAAAAVPGHSQNPQQDNLHTLLEHITVQQDATMQVLLQALIAASRELGHG